VREPVVLICDDDPQIVRLIESVIAGIGGVRTIAAYDGEEALALAYAEYPALLLLDLKIPKVSGPIVARRLKADPLTRDLPIVAVSALKNGPTLAQDAGCDGWLSKPFDIDELAMIVRAFVGVDVAPAPKS
jgi:two-component system, cell cycle response regulator DivK